MVVATKTDSKLSAGNDSTEDLLIIPVSETESIDEEIAPVPRASNQRGKIGAFVTSTYVCTKSCGKRKRRQYENFIALLQKGPIDMHIPTIHDFFPVSHRSLITLLEECSIYEAFCYGCEDFFEKLEGIKSTNRNSSQRKLKIQRNDAQSTIVHISSSGNSFVEMNAFLRVEESVRCAVVSGSIPQDLVRDLENKLVRFFMNNPREIFMLRGLSSTERTAMYAICKFHHLTYKCYRKRRYHIVQIRNANYTFEEPSIHLSTVLSKWVTSCSSEQHKN